MKALKDEIWIYFEKKKQQPLSFWLGCWTDLNEAKTQII